MPTGRMIAKRYPTLRGKTHALLRAWMCPFNSMDSHLPSSGVIADIGCAEGVFSHFLAASSKERSVIGYDIDGRKIELARKVAGPDGNVEFENANVLSASYPELDGVVVSDFLHHLAPDDQLALLDVISQHVKPGGVLVMKEVDEGDGWRRHLSRFWDRVLYPQDSPYYRPMDQWADLLSGRGFRVRYRRSKMHRHIPGSTNLLVAERT